MNSMDKKDWIVLFLNEKPLDGIRLMKGLFFVWHRSGRKTDGFFEFVPYNYGPCSFEFYRALESAQNAGLVTQAPHPTPNWARYFITEKGRNRAAQIADRLDSKLRNLVRSVASEVEPMGFYQLLIRVYAEAPDYAVNSVLLEDAK